MLVVQRMSNTAYTLRTCDGGPVATMTARIEDWLQDEVESFWEAHGEKPSFPDEISSLLNENARVERLLGGGG